MPRAKISFARFQFSVLAFELAHPLLGFGCHPFAVPCIDLSFGVPSDVGSLGSYRACLQQR